MLSSDPAVEAAKKAWTGFAGGMFAATDPEYLGLLNAAREALKPLRAKHYPVAYVDRRRCCVTCFDRHGKPKLWPCDIAPLIYPSEELQ